MSYGKKMKKKIQTKQTNVLEFPMLPWESEFLLFHSSGPSRTGLNGLVRPRATESTSLLSMTSSFSVSSFGTWLQSRVVSSYK